VRHFCNKRVKTYAFFEVDDDLASGCLVQRLSFGMILRPRDKRGRAPRLRLGIVASLVLALLAFPCGPVATALVPEVGHAHAAVPANAGQGEAECAHGTKKHESSCCNSCSSWLTARGDTGAAAVLGHAPQRDLQATPAYTPAIYVGIDQEQRLTGPPPVGSLDGTKIYSRTQRYRI
jgi:hypothetical protein